ncbi:MAG: LysR family transcriptional regulator [Myxococcota bacterium]
MLPDLVSVRCFVEAATQLNFREASRRVALSPAAFSGRVQQLEEQLGVVLFERSTRHVALTEAGARLLPHARKLLADAGSLAAAARGDGVPVPFELVLGTRWELGMSWLVPSLATLRENRPERTLHVQFGDSADLLGRVHRLQVDAMISSVRLTGAGIEYATLHPEDYVFVGVPGTRLDGPDDAPAHVLVDAHPDLPLFRYLLDARPAGEAWRFARTELLAAIGAIRHRVLEGAGVAVLPRYFVAADLAEGRLVRLMPRAKLLADAFRLVWRSGHAREAELRMLAAELSAIPVR